MIYILNFQYEPNSASGNRLMAYYKAMDQLGVKATIVFLYPNNNRDIFSEKFNNIKVLNFWHTWMPYRGVFRKLTINRYINRFMKLLNPGDIVYTYNVSKLNSLCQRIRGVKVYAERTEHPEANIGFPHPLLALNDTELKDTLCNLDGLFVISEPLKDYYISQGVAEDKIHIINMTVDTSRFHNLERNPKERYIAYCGTASNNKDGVDQLIMAFAIVAKQINDVKLYIIGKTPSKDQKFGNLELVKSLGIEDRVVFTGMVKASFMPQLLNNAEVLALNRPDNLQAKYGFPTKLGEYLLTENPVVVTSVGDIPKFLKDGESAFIAKPSCPDDFASKLITALKDRDFASQVGRRGKAVAMNSFNSFFETQKLVNYLK